MKQFYLDSSENATASAEDAIVWFDTIEEARSGAIQHAAESPSTIFYVREIVQSSKLVYRAEATLKIDSEVIDDPTLQG